jgi:hypothetical protein
MAAGHFRDGTITVYYRTSGTVGPAQAQLVKRDLVNLGFAESNITMKGFSGGDIYEAFLLRGTDADLAVSVGFCRDIAEPVEYFLPSQGPPWFPDSPKYRAKLAAVAALPKKKQAKALGRLDLDIMRNVAPFAVMNHYNNKFFFSDSVDPRSLRYHSVYQDWSIPSLALK